MTLLLVIAASCRWYHVAATTRGVSSSPTGHDGLAYGASAVQHQTWAGSQTLFGLIVLDIGLVVFARALAGCSPRLTRTWLGRVPPQRLLLPASAAALLATLAGLAWRPDVTTASGGGGAGVAPSLGLPLALLAAVALGALGVARLPRPQQTEPARVYRFPATRGGGDVRRDSRPL